MDTSITISTIVTINNKTLESSKVNRNKSKISKLNSIWSNYKMN